MPAHDAPHPGPIALTIASLGLAAVTVQQPSGTLLRLDALSLAIGCLILFVSAAVAAFAWRYMRASGRSQFLMRGAGLVASTLVFAAADHVLLFAAGWIVSGVLLARLIGHAEGWAEAQKVSRDARGLFMMCDAALVAGLALLTARMGSTSIAEIVTRAPEAPAFSTTLAASFLAVAALARCALPPFSTWLLNSMTAPTPVSALMHAGLVNAGGFLFLRFAGLFEAAPLVRLAMATLGILGALYGAGIMLVRPEIKRTLAGSTVSQMGFMILSCSLGAYAAALWHLIAHGLFKAWLFLGSGSTACATLAKPERPRAVLALAATTAIVSALVIAGPLQPGSPSFVPVTLIILTGALTAAMIPSAIRDWSQAARMLGLLAALLALHGAGFGIAGAVVGQNGPPLLPVAGHIALVLLFGGVLAWQFRPAAREKPGLPPAIYVRLLNAGSTAA